MQNRTHYILLWTMYPITRHLLWVGRTLLLPQHQVCCAMQIKHTIWMWTLLQNRFRLKILSSAPSWCCNTIFSYFCSSIWGTFSNKFEVNRRAKFKKCKYFAFLRLKNWKVNPFQNQSGHSNISGKFKLTQWKVSDS